MVVPIKLDQEIAGKAHLEDLKSLSFFETPLHSYDQNKPLH